MALARLARTALPALVAGAVAFVGACGAETAGGDVADATAAADAPGPDAAEPRGDSTAEAGLDARADGGGAASVWSSPGACEAALGAGAKNPRQSPDALRVGTWNVRFFPDGAPPGSAPRPTDTAWLACTLAWLDADVFVLEEIMAPERSAAPLAALAGALSSRTGGDWRSAVDACSRGPNGLHVAFLYDAKRVALDDFEVVAWDGGGAGACGAGRRSAFTARATPNLGAPVRLVGVHAKSGADATSFASRDAALAALPSVLASIGAASPAHVLVAGDFNTMGCETCDTPVTAPEEIGRLDARLPPAGLRRVAPGAACSYLDPIRPGLLDHVLLSSELARSSSPTAWTAGFCVDLACDPAGAREHPAYGALSDHCPLLVNVVAR